MAEKQKITKDQVIWQTEKFVIFREADGSISRYMPAFKAKFPVTLTEQQLEIVRDAALLWEDL
jgi:glutathione peroxidase-family protein